MTTLTLTAADFTTPTTPAHVFPTAEGTEVRVWNLRGHGWSVTVYDPESGGTIPGRRFHAADPLASLAGTAALEAKALAFARDLAARS